MAFSDSIKLTMSSSEEIGKAIQKQRKAQKITQKEFAQRLGKSERTIQKYESGEILLKINHKKKIAKALEKLEINDVIIPCRILNDRQCGRFPCAPLCTRIQGL